MRLLRVLAVAWLVGVSARGVAGLAYSQAVDDTRRVTFAEHIAPIVFANCSSCHRPAGLAPFSLLSYAEVKRRGQLVAAATKSRYMPPWKPEPGHGDFEGVRRLRAEQIELIQRWVAGGMAEGDARLLPPAPRWKSTWQIGEPDLVLEMPQPYTVRAAGEDLYRQFVVRFPISSRRFIKAWEFRPGNPKVVHHATLHIDPTQSSRRLEEADPEPGYEGLIANSARFPEGYFLEWTPGHTPYIAPEGMAFPVEANSDIVISLHLRPTGRPESVKASVALYFADAPPERVPVTLRLTAQDMDIAPGEKRYTATRSYRLPVDVDVFTVQPHAHYLARQVEGFATLPDGRIERLIEIRDWDFGWQDVYRYATPVFLPAGTTVVMRWTYDNSEDNPRNPHTPPRRVTYGQRTSDEMSELWFQVFPRRQPDREVLTRELRARLLAEEITGHEMMLRANPNQASLHDDTALLYAQVGDFGQVAAHFAETVRLRPDSAAHYNLGSALLSLGEATEALAHFRRSLEIDPAYGNAHRGAGLALEAEGQRDEAARHYAEAIRLVPTDAVAHLRLGVLLQSQGKVDEAIGHYRDALAIDRGSFETHHAMATALRSRGRVADAITHYRAALQLNPGWQDVLIELAWLLATTPDPDTRRPDEALQLARRAAELSRSRDPGTLDVLAAALAAGGRYEEAVATAEEALALAEVGRHADAAGRIRERLEGYRLRRPPQ